MGAGGPPGTATYVYGVVRAGQATKIDATGVGGRAPRGYADDDHVLPERNDHG